MKVLLDVVIIIAASVAFLAACCALCTFLKDEDDGK